MQEGIRTLGLALLHFLWQGALIGVIAAGALRAVATRSARHRYIICLLGLLSCLAAPLITAAYLVAYQPTTVRTEVAMLSGAATGPTATEMPPRAVAAHIDRSGATPMATPAAVRKIDSRSAIDWIAVSVALWSLGATIVACYYLAQWLAVERMRRSAFALRDPPALSASGARLLSRWKRTARVPLMLSYAVVSPVVIGLWRPMIVFPAATIARMSVADFELILLHEIAHIVRRDVWVNTLQVALQILLFYHPVIHWLSRRTRLERECACDDFAVSASGSAYRYAQALTSLALTKSSPLPLGLGVAGADLLPRLRNLAGECSDVEDSRRSPALLFLIGLLLVLLASLTAAPPVRPGHINRVAPLSLAASEHEPASVVPVQRNPLPVPKSLAPAARLEYGGGVERAGRSASTHSEVRGDRARTRTLTHVAPAGALTAGAEPAAASASGSSIAAKQTANSGEQAGNTPVLATTSEPAAPATVADPEAPGAKPATAAGPAGYSLVYAPPPDYPVRARLEGVEGWVTFQLRFGPDGRPTGLRILQATPLGVFEGAVRRTVMRWRFGCSTGCNPPAELEAAFRLNFTIAGVSTTAAPVCANSTVSRTCATQ